MIELSGERLGTVVKFYQTKGLLRCFMMQRPPMELSLRLWASLQRQKLTIGHLKALKYGIHQINYTPTDVTLIYTFSKEIQNAVIDQLVKIYGPNARHPKQFMMKDWSQEHWSKGCYVGSFSIFQFIHFFSLSW